jgi:SOS-response transcriptional repressors (RecA-mediated autopeptidases)
MTNGSSNSKRLTCPNCDAVLTVHPLPLTPRQLEVLRWLAGYIERCGFAPSLDEIAIGCGYASLASVHEMLGTLENKGWLMREYNTARGIALLCDLPSSAPNAAPNPAGRARGDGP